MTAQPHSGREYETGLGHDLVRAWRTSGALRIADDEVRPRLHRAFASSRRFFASSAGHKSRFVSDLTYAGYAAPGEEAGRAATTEAAPCEAFTVCQDIAPDDPRVCERWPCHGPVPWPDAEFRRAMLALTDALGAVADRLLRELAITLGLGDPDVFARLTWSGWHHLRAVHIPPDTGATDVSAEQDGLLAITMRDDCDLLTILPGALMGFVTGAIAGTPPLALQPPPFPPEARDRYTITYFHVPNFQACIVPASSVPDGGYLHYGTHFTTTLMHRYPERVTTLRIMAEDRLAVLAGLREQAATAASALIPWPEHSSSYRTDSNISEEKIDQSITDIDTTSVRR